MKPDCAKYAESYIERHGLPTSLDKFRLDLLQAWTEGHCSGIEKGFAIGTGETMPVYNPDIHKSSIEPYEAANAPK